MAPQEANVNRDVLQLIIDTLANLQQRDGTADDDKLWSVVSGGFGPTKLPMACELLGPSLNNALAVFRHFEAMKDALYELARSCERRLEALKTESRPSFLHYGIQTLPDDILAHIFDLYVHENDDFDDSQPEHILSHVCHRFRSLSLSLPPLWSRVTSSMSKASVDIHLGRSKSTALTVVIEESEWSKELEQFIRLITPHISRWKSFRLRLIFIDEMHPDFPATLAKYLGNLHLPILESFGLYFNDDSASEIVDFNDFNFYKTWNTPKIRYIDTSELIPSFLSGVFSSSAIRSFDFSWTNGKCDMRSLMDILISLPNLSELQLDITNNTGGNPNRGRRGHGDVLPRLTDLTFKTHIPGALSAIMHYLRMPMLEKLHLEIENSFEFLPARKWLECLPLGACFSVNNLILSLSESRQDRLDLSTLFRRFPRLQRLNMNAPGTIPFFNYGEVEMPPLRSLSVELGSRNSWSYLEDFVEKLKRKGIWDEFEFFQLKGDGLLSKREAEEILTKDKLKWCE